MRLNGIYCGFDVNQIIYAVKNTPPTPVNAARKQYPYIPNKFSQFFQFPYSNFFLGLIFECW